MVWIVKVVNYMLRIGSFSVCCGGEVVFVGPIALSRATGGLVGVSVSVSTG